MLYNRQHVRGKPVPEQNEYTSGSSPKQRRISKLLSRLVRIAAHKFHMHEV